MLSKDKSSTDTQKPKTFTVGIILIMVLLSFCFFSRCVLVYQSINRSFICHLDTNILHLQQISRRPLQAQLSFSREVPFNLRTNHQKSDWGGGEGGKKQKKIHARENAGKKEGKEKKFMQKEGPIVTFSESLSFRNQQYYQAQYE